MRSGVSGRVSSVAVDPRHPGVAYAGLDQGGVFKKVRGRWHAINQGLGEPGVHDVAVDPHRSRVLYAAADTGLFNTTDGGQHWRRVLPSGTFRQCPSCASVTRRGGAHAITVAGPETVYAAITERGRWSLWKSVDRGASWRRLPRRAGPSDDGPLALAAGASDPDTVYVAGGSGLAASTDGGATWHDADPPGDPDHRHRGPPAAGRHRLCRHRSRIVHQHQRRPDLATGGRRPRTGPRDRSGHRSRTRGPALRGHRERDLLEREQRRELEPVRHHGSRHEPSTTSRPRPPA